MTITLIILSTLCAVLALAVAGLKRRNRIMLQILTDLTTAANAAASIITNNVATPQQVTDAQAALTALNSAISPPAATGTATTIPTT